jgi:hypothetical protein
MWNRVNIFQIAAGLNYGTLISKVPEDLKEYYKILSHSDKHIEATRINGNLSVIVIHTDKLITDKWWVRNEK